MTPNNLEALNMAAFFIETLANLRGEEFKTAAQTAENLRTAISSLEANMRMTDSVLNEGTRVIEELRQQIKKNEYRDSVTPHYIQNLFVNYKLDGHGENMANFLEGWGLYHQAAVVFNDCSYLGSKRMDRCREGYKRCMELAKKTA